MSSCPSCRKIFIYVDADKVGELLELCLLEGNVRSAEQVHNRVQNAIRTLRSQVLAFPEAEIVFAGCDDVLFSVPAEAYQREMLDQLRAGFNRESNLTISAGVGKDVAGALLSLRKAKLSGRDRIVEALG